MSQPPWDDDEHLLAELAAALHEDEDTAELRRQGEAAFTWRTVDQELAALVYDSLLDDGLLARARSRAERRIVIFENGPVRVELEVTREGIVGQLTPAAGAAVELLGADGVAVATETDGAGSFVLDIPLTSPVRLRLRSGDDVVVTDWIGL